MGKLEAIWLKRMKGGPMDPVTSATLKVSRGLVGNANQGGKRQVTLLNQVVWEDRTAQLGVMLEPATRRANLLVSGDIDLAESRHKILRIGSCRVTRSQGRKGARAQGHQESSCDPATLLPCDLE
jgi:hypothetical protein